MSKGAPGAGDVENAIGSGGALRLTKRQQETHVNKRRVEHCEQVGVCKSAADYHREGVTKACALQWMSRKEGSARWQRSEGSERMKKRLNARRES